MFVAGGLALGIGLAVGSSAGEVEAGVNNWVLADSLDDLLDNAKYAITFEGDYLIPGSYNVSPSNGEFSTATAVEANAWTFKNVGVNQWRITDGTNWLKNEYNGPGGLRTQNSDPATYFTADLLEVDGKGPRITLSSSYEGNRQITRAYSEGYYDDWRSFASSSTGNELELYKYVPSVLETISIKTPATNTTFSLGESFEHAGLVITADYNTGPVDVETGFDVTGIDTGVLGLQTATITYEEETVTYNVQVTIEGTIATALEQATAYADYVMTGIGNNAAGRCLAAIAALEAEYNHLSEDAKSEFSTNEGTLFVEARIRIAYLNSWSASQSAGNTGILAAFARDNTPLIIIAITIAGTMILGSIFYLRKKKENN